MSSLLQKLLILPKSIFQKATVVDWGKADIDGLAKTEQDNFLTAQRMLPQDLGFYKRVRQLYHGFTHNIDGSKFLPIRLFFDCAKFFDFSTITLMRGHITEAMFELRRAVEATAFAFKMKDPKAMEIWVTKDYLDDEFKQYLRTDKWAGCGSLLRLKSFWENTSSIAGHAVLSSQVYRHEKIKENTYLHGYFDVKENHSYSVKLYLNYILLGNVLILETFGELFKDNFIAEWYEAFLGISADYNRYRIGPLKTWLDQNSPSKPPPSSILIPKPGEVLALLFAIENQRTK